MGGGGALRRRREGARGLPGLLEEPKSLPEGSGEGPRETETTAEERGGRTEGSPPELPETVFGWQVLGLRAVEVTTGTEEAGRGSGLGR